MHLRRTTIRHELLCRLRALDDAVSCLFDIAVPRARWLVGIHDTDLDGSCVPCACRISWCSVGMSDVKSKEKLGVLRNMAVAQVIIECVCRALRSRFSVGSTLLHLH